MQPIGDQYVAGATWWAIIARHDADHAPRIKGLAKPYRLRQYSGLKRNAADGRPAIAGNNQQARAGEQYDITRLAYRVLVVKAPRSWIFPSNF
jgi:hypothetical protein